MRIASSAGRCARKNNRRVLKHRRRAKTKTILEMKVKVKVETNFFRNIKPTLKEAMGPLPLSLDYQLAPLKEACSVP